MLPILIKTDILQYTPDVDGLDLWASNVSYKTFPAKPGVYCFYDANTKEILYVGSAHARSTKPDKHGLAVRLMDYRRVGGGNKIQDERQNRKILVRCWSTQCAVDALKYECDAIEKYKPVLNDILAKPVQSIKEHTRAQERLRLKNSLLPPLPKTTIKRCHDCELSKPLLEFYRQPTVKGGYGAYCKECSKKRVVGIRQKFRLRTQEELPSEDTSKLCACCGISKLLSEFSVNSGSKDGRQSYCKECSKMKRMDARQRFGSRTQEQLSPETTLKRCPMCGKEKPLMEFYRSTYSKDGCQSYCKDCFKTKGRKIKT